MNYILDLTIVLCLVSLIANAILSFFLLRTKKTKAQMTYDAKALLTDLASGPALVKIEYVDRSEIFLRSPRNM